MSDLNEQIEALLALDAKGTLVPHGIGGLARELLTRSLTELTTLRSQLSGMTEETSSWERKRAIAAIHWVFSADGTVGERAMAQEAIHKINDPTFMPEANK